MGTVTTQSLHDVSWPTFRDYPSRSPGLVCARRVSYVVGLINFSIGCIKWGHIPIFPADAAKTSSRPIRERRSDCFFQTWTTKSRLLYDVRTPLYCNIFASTKINRKAESLSHLQNIQFIRYLWIRWTSRLYRSKVTVISQGQLTHRINCSKMLV